MIERTVTGQDFVEESEIVTEVESSLSASDVDAMITLRLLDFHRGLVERGQIAPAPTCSDGIEASD
jgi:hypothetical protein